MTQASNLSLSLTPSPAATSSGPADFVTLEQVAPPVEQQYVSIAALYRMWLRSLSGIAAGLYRPQGCPIEFMEGNVHIWFDFYALPSHPDLPFMLSSNIGEISTPEIVALPRERDIVFEMRDSVELDFFVQSAMLHWQSPCYLPGCITTPPPQPSIEETVIRVPEPLFGVARLAATAYARKYRLDIVIEKGANRITNLEPIITAAWIGAAGKTVTEQLDLVVPDCVRHALALCAGDLHDTICTIRYPPPTIYVSECSGSTLDVRGGDPESWCARV